MMASGQHSHLPPVLYVGKAVPV